MISGGIQAFDGKRVLLLQGPVGPFFLRLAQDLRHAGAVVHKINFNGGDWLFYPKDALQYRGTMDAWPHFFAEFVDTHAIDTVLLFGDIRPVHRTIYPIAEQKGLRIGVFEEGYIRPDYITFELHGANANSKLPRNPEFYLEQDTPPVPAPERVHKPYCRMALWASLYWVAGSMGKPLFPRYRHHRPLSLTEAVPWIRSGWRKLYYRYRENGLQERLVNEYDGRYFLVPLQVHNDSQLFAHSKFDSVRNFIEELVASFAGNAPDDTILAFKHHPQDRGYYDYRRLIGELASFYHLDGRIFYIHDQYLPTLLSHARGVVTINSTAGISALHHRCPIKVCGDAIYDIDGLTFQGPLDAFWVAAPSHKPQQPLYQRYRSYLISHTQLNGSFYKRLTRQHKGAGIIWSSNHDNAPHQALPAQPLNNSILSRFRAIISKLLSNRLFLITVLIPTILSTLYFGLIKSDVYVSESHFIVRTPQKQMASGLEAVLQGVGFSGSADDTHSVHDYMMSRDALYSVDRQVGLRRSFGNSGIDLFSRFNPLGLDDSFEALYRYYQSQVQVNLNASSAISVLKVRAYRAEDAYRINELLLAKGEGLINQLNDRARKDLIGYAQKEVDLAADKSRDASAKLAAYRNQSGVVDPINQSALQLQQVSKLQDEYIATKTRLAQVQLFTPQSPQIPTLQNMLATLKDEIDNETSKVAGSDPSLANKAVEYERLLLEQKFAEKQLAAAMTALEQARSEAQRKQLYLERIVQPNKPDIAIEPQRVKAIFTTLLVGFISWGILSMLIAGVKEHHD